MVSPGIFLIYWPQSMVLPDQCWSQHYLSSFLYILHRILEDANNSQRSKQNDFFHKTIKFSLKNFMKFQKGKYNLIPEHLPNSKLGILLLASASSSHFYLENEKTMTIKGWILLLQGQTANKWQSWDTIQKS